MGQKESKSLPQQGQFMATQGAAVTKGHKGHTQDHKRPQRAAHAAPPISMIWARSITFHAEWSSTEGSRLRERT